MKWVFIQNVTLIVDVGKKKTVPEKVKYKRAFLATPEQYFTPFKP